MAISLVASIAYIFTMFGLDEALRDGVLRTVAAWLPNILFMLAGALMLCYRREDREGRRVYESVRDRSTKVTSSCQFHNHLVIS